MLAVYHDLNLFKSNLSYFSQRGGRFCCNIYHVNQCLIGSLVSTILELNLADFPKYIRDILKEKT